ncbi:MAG: hypothetical protein ACE5JU_21180 [Candidatus Binatia bacterium]
MSQAKPKIEGISIVLLGAFSPPIFQPAWFALHDLIRSEEAEAATVEVIHTEVVSFSIAAVKLQVTPNRYAASTVNPSAYEVLRDLTLGAFRILSHTPIRAMGLNWDLHFRMTSEQSWHEAGHRLAPKDLWTGIIEKPGMRSLTMEGVRPDSNPGYIRVRVEPSIQVHPGVYININDHYEIKDHKPEQGCEDILNILLSNWKAFLNRSQMATSLITGLM